MRVGKEEVYYEYASLLCFTQVGSPLVKLWYVMYTASSWIGSLT